MAFSDSLKRERERKGLTQSQLADRLGITQAAVSQFENGITTPTVALAVLIAKELGTTCEKMVTE